MTFTHKHIQISPKKIAPFKSWTLSKKTFNHLISFSAQAPKKWSPSKISSWKTAWVSELKLRTIAAFQGLGSSMEDWKLGPGNRRLDLISYVKLQHPNEKLCFLIFIVHLSQSTTKLAQTTHQAEYAPVGVHFSLIVVFTVCGTTLLLHVFPFTFASISFFTTKGFHFLLYAALQKQQFCFWQKKGFQN